MSFLDNYYAPQRKLFSLPLVKLVPLLVVTVLACGAIGYMAATLPWLILALVPVLFIAMYNAISTGLLLVLENKAIWENRLALTGFCSLLLSKIVLISTCIGLSIALGDPAIPRIMAVGLVVSLLFILITRMRIIRTPA